MAKAKIILNVRSRRFSDSLEVSIPWLSLLLSTLFIDKDIPKVLLKHAPGSDLFLIIIKPSTRRPLKGEYIRQLDTVVPEVVRADAFVNSRSDQTTALH